jgi:hypothetical protein
MSSVYLLLLGHPATILGLAAEAIAQLRRRTMGRLQTQMKNAANDRLGRTEIEKPNAVLNEAGGLAFTVDSPVAKLIFTTGQFLGEPKYYEGAQVKNVDGSDIKYLSDLNAKLASKGVVKWARQTLDANTREIIETAIAVANSSDPKDLLVVAHWLRQEMNIRLTPSLFLAIAGNVNATKPFVREYAPNIIQRLDDTYNVLMFHNCLFGGRLPNCLARGLMDALCKFDEYAILKYKRATHPNLTDVLKVIDRKKDKPFNKEIVNYLYNGVVPSVEAAPVINARVEFNKLTKFDAKAQKLAEDARVTWEVLSSQFAGKEKEKVWSFMLSSGMLGHMALLRNLNNILGSVKDSDAIKGVAAKICDEQAVLKGRQLPFRYLSAYNAINPQSYGWGHTPSMNAVDIDPFTRKKVNKALEKAIAIAANNLPDLPGRTAIFADNSGSMTATVSDKSVVRCSDVANLLCSIQASKGESIVGAFGTDVAYVDISDVPVIKASKIIKEANTKGMATNGYRCVDSLLSKKTWVDRVVILTDMQLWSTGGYGSYGYDRQLSGSWAKYEKACKAATGKLPYLHLVNLAGSTTSPADSNKSNVNIVGGFSEKILGMLLTFESEGEVEVQAANLPGIKDLRERF